MNNYVPYHIHDQLSLLDSVTDFKEYVDKAVEYNMKAIACTNHGNVYKWIERFLYCKEKGIKYIHGCEVYLTETLDEKIRDNYHTVLLAKNQEGLKELHTLLDLSTHPSHVYYKNRISFDEFLNISDNIIKTSACLASPLQKLDEGNPYYDKLAKHYDFFEIQYHNCEEQKEFNRKLYKLSKKYNKPLIVGTDTHSINEYKAECRYIRQLSKNITFSNEDTFDLTFKSYEELVKMFKEQNCLPMDVVLEAIENTNKIADMCEEIKLDTSFKYPILSKDDEKTLIDRIEKMYKDKVDRGIIDGNNEKYKENLKEELRVFKKLNMISFMLFMSEMMEWCEKNNIPTCPCRGSVGGSTLAYIIGITDVDPIRWGTIFSRFANEDRLEIGDIDVDFSPDQRELVYNYIINRFGQEKTAYILSIGTVSDKGTIDDIGRALDKKYKDKGLESPYSLDQVKIIKEEYEENPEETRLKYSELFYYFDGILNSVVSQSVHPAGIVASPVTLTDNYGTFWKDGMKILQIDMEEVHEVSLVKYDILGLKNIGIIKDCCEYANIPYPKSYNIDFNDDNVWEDMVKYPYGIFQFESDYANKLLRQFNPHRINDMNLVNASLRPSGESYRDNLIAGIPNKNPSEIIDNLLKQNNGYLVFQEDTIAFLQDICGLSGSDADNIRRAIGRKQRDRLEKAMPQILEGYCSKSNKPRDIAEKEAQEFLQIIEDSANYQFGKNHATGYSMIGYYCAYLRYYYPLEFTCAYLNNAANNEDFVNGEKLAKLLGIKLQSPKFGYSKAEYFFNKETNTIYKGVGSIKYLNGQKANILYELSQSKKYETFTDVLFDTKEIGNRCLEILIKLGYFSEFGCISKLLKVFELYKDKGNKKTMSKTKDIELYMTYKELAERNATKETAKVLNMDYHSFIRDVELSLEDVEDDVIELIKNEIEYTGGFNKVAYKQMDKNACFISDLKIFKYNIEVELFCFYSGNAKIFKMDKQLYNQCPFVMGEVLYLYGFIPKKRKKNNIVDYYITDFEVA